VHLLLRVLEPLHPAVLIAGAAIVLCAFSRNLGPALRGLQHPAVYCVLGLMGWAALSVPGSLYPGGSFRFLAGEYAKTILMALVMAVGVRGVRDVERLLMAFFLAAAIYAVVVLSRFDIAPGERLAELYTYDANDLALFLVCAVPFGLFLFLRNAGWLRRGLAVGALVTLAAVIVRTGSRGGFLALVAVMLVTVATWTFVKVRWRALSAAAGLVIFLASANAGYWGLMSNLLNLSNDYNVTSVGGRIQVWKRGLGYMSGHPILGVGINAFPAAEGRLAGVANLPGGRGFKWSVAHNSLVQVGAELGVPGLVMFCAFLWQLFRTAWRLSQRDRSGQFALPPPGAALAAVLLTSLVGFFVAAFFLSQAYGSVLYFLAAMVLGLRQLAVRARQAPPPAPRWARQ